MATKKRTTRKSSPRKATKKTAKKKLEKLEKNTVNQDEQVEETKGQHGGAREGAGRKPAEDRERLQTLKDKAEDHALEEVAIAVTEGGTTKKVKMARHVALLDVLFQEGLKRKSIPAIKEYFDRTRGKAVQPLQHSGEIKTEDQFIPDDPATEAAHEAYMKTRKRLIAEGYYDTIEPDEEGE